LVDLSMKESALEEIYVKMMTKEVAQEQDKSS
jgi:hypothetical protein